MLRFTVQVDRVGRTSSCPVHCLLQRYYFPGPSDYDKSNTPLSVKHLYRPRMTGLDVWGFSIFQRRTFSVRNSAVCVRNEIVVSKNYARRYVPNNYWDGILHTSEKVCSIPVRHPFQSLNLKIIPDDALPNHDYV